MTAPCMIEVALNGTTTKAANPHVPRTPAEIAADAHACIEAGATIVHNHNDEPMWVADGVHAAAPYREAWSAILAEHPGTLLYATQASGGPGIAIETRWAHHEALADLTPLALVDPGSVSLGGDRVYINTHDDARHGFERCAALGLAPSISVFDPSFLRVALRHEPRAGVIKLYFGGDALPFGLPPTEPSLDAYLAMLDGSGLPWLAAVLGGDVTTIAAAVLERGGHLRVGLEDYAGPRTPRNVELVHEAAALIESSGRTVATAAQARALVQPTASATVA